MVRPVSELTTDREPLSARPSLGMKGDDRLLTEADNARLATLQRRVSHLRADVPSDRLKVDFLRFSDPRFLSMRSAGESLP